jgi:ribosomal protein S18 acetylase RimI-like enzyme
MQAAGGAATWLHHGMSRLAELALRAIAKDEREDLRAFADLYWDELMPDAPVIRDLERRAAYFDSLFRFGDPATLLLWATLGGIPIGFARAGLWENHDGLAGTIHDFYIDVPFRRRGFGRRFAGRIVEDLRARGVHRIDLSARADNPAALAFWRAAGFSVAAYQLRQYLG